MDATTLALTLATAAAMLAGALTGEHQRRRLNTLAYRYPDETADEWPAPGPRVWVPVVLSVGLGLLVWRYTSQGTPEHLLYLIPMAIPAPWLAAVDADVHRLPYRATLLTLVVSVIGLLTAAAITGQWLTIALAGGLGWVLTYAVFWVIHKSTDVGYGDVRLGALIGLTTVPLAPWGPWASVLIGSIAAALWVVTGPRTRKGRFAYGPWLLLGWYVITLIT